MDITKIDEVIKKLCIGNQYAITVIKSGIKDVDLPSVNEELFDRWFENQISYLKSGKYRASLFVTAFTSEYANGTFTKVEDHEKHADQMEVEDEEEVKRQAEEWIDLVFELDDDFPSGIYYDAAGKRRGYFDGEGGFVYEGNGQ